MPFSLNAAIVAKPYGISAETTPNATKRPSWIFIKAPVPIINPSVNESIATPKNIAQAAVDRSSPNLPWTKLIRLSIVTKKMPPKTKANITIQGVLVFKAWGISTTLITANMIPVAACKAKL